MLVILVWLRLGSSDSGGAFQSGAVLAGALILLRSAGVPLDRLTGRWPRLQRTGSSVAMLSVKA